MYYFVQYNAEGSEAWRMVAADKPLSSPVAFKTILQVSSDPDAFVDQGIDPSDKVKYFGPMYFDFDGDPEDVSDVIEEAKILYQELTETEGIDSKSISIFLSGGRGVHFTILPKVFGVVKPTVALPLYWGLYASRFYDTYQFIDKSVYSLGKGRMWRTTEVQRTNGKWKVQITAKELADLTVESYAELTSEQREEFNLSSEILPNPSLVSFFEAAHDKVKAILRGRTTADAPETLERLKDLTSTPGCVLKLITQGDCPDSNWNQAAMQLAGYIAGKYDQTDDKEDYTSNLIDPFIRNVQSSSRPTEGARLKAFNYVLKRAFQGNIKFSVGGIIKVIGRKCGECPICSGELTKGNVMVNEDDEFGFYDPQTRIRISRDSVVRAGEDKDVLLMRTGFRIVKHEVVYDKELQSEHHYNTTFQFPNGVMMDADESCLTDKRSFNNGLSSCGQPFLGQERDYQEMFTTLKKLREGTEKMIRSERCGLILHESRGQVYPHYVGRDNSFRKGNLPSEFVFVGSAHTAPDISRLPDVETEEDAEMMVDVMLRLFRINSSVLMTQAIGWVCAANIKPFITANGKRGFPLLNFAGSSHTGKSSTAYLLLALNGFPMRQVPIWNAEIDTPYPLEELVVSSSTVVRMIEEANEHTAGRNWERLIGFLKGAWDEAGISRGTVKRKNIEVITRKNTAPIMYLSEQPSTIQSIRTRGVECMFKPATLFKGDHKADFTFVEKNSRYVEMMGKVLISTSLGISYKHVDTWEEDAIAMLGDLFNGRTQQAYVTLLIGLKFLQYVISHYSRDAAEVIQGHMEHSISYWQANSNSVVQRMSRSAVDEVITNFDLMAGEEHNEMYGLVAGVHYWRNGDLLLLDIHSMFPRYRRFTRSQGVEGTIKAVTQLTELLAGEVYFEGKIPHPSREGLDLHIVNTTKLAQKSITLPFMQEYALEE